MNFSSDNLKLSFVCRSPTKSIINLIYCEKNKLILNLCTVMCVKDLYNSIRMYINNVIDFTNTIIF